LLNSNSPYLI